MAEKKKKGIPKRNMATAIFAKPKKKKSVGKTIGRSKA
jgi:hypothetical protein